MGRILRFLLAMAGLLGTLQAQTPTTIPVTGNLGTIIGFGQPYAGVAIQLVNCPAPVAITGFWGIVQTGYEIQADSAGTVNSSIWPNDKITCNGTTGNSQYAVTFMVNGQPSAPAQCYQAPSSLGVWNLNVLQPISCTATPPNPQDQTWNNLTLLGFLTGTSGSFSGNLAIGGTLNVTGMTFAHGGLTLGTLPTACTSGNFMSGLSVTLQPVCSALSGIGVTSFNGRIGAVVPANGDYSYSQISATPTLYYQTVQANGTPVAQQPVLNFDTTLSATAGSGKTNVGLPSVGSAGACAFPSSITFDAQGRATNCTAGTVSSIIARVSGSCVLVDDVSGGSGCISSAISWGVTMPGTYYAWCAVNALSNSVLWQNHTSVSIVGTPPLSSSTVTFALDNNQSAGRGQTATVTCWATN